MCEHPFNKLILLRASSNNPMDDIKSYYKAIMKCTECGAVFEFSTVTGWKGAYFRDGERIL